MKNRNMFLSVALAMCLFMIAGSSSAQFTKLWQVSPGTWPMVTGDNVRGAAYNPATGHYLIARRDIPRIYVFNGSTGALMDSLDMTGVTGGTLKLTDIEVTTDGVIYGSNLILNSGSDTTFKVYRWADETNTTVPTVAYEGRPTSKASARLGDAFDVAGTGNNTVIYVGGNNSATTEIQVLTTADGSTFTRTGGIAITGQDAGAGIAQTSPGGNPYTSRFASNNPVRYYSAAGAGRLDFVPTSVNPGPQADIGYLEAAGRKWLATSVNKRSNGGGAALFNVTYGAGGAVFVGETDTLGNTTNSNASGDVELLYNAADSSMTVFVLADNNGFAAFKSGNVLLANLNPYASNLIRTIYVPMKNQNDTVYVDVQDDGYIPAGKVMLNYAVNGGDYSAVVMELVSGDSTNGKYRGIIPGSVNQDGNRVEYYVSMEDNLAAMVSSATFGYFAGMTKMDIAGPRAIDTSGVAKYKGYGVRVQGVCIMEDSITYDYQLDAVIQDGMGGMNIFHSGKLLDNFVRGNLYVVEGVIDQYRGKVELTVPPGMTQMKIMNEGPVAMPKPRMATVGDFAFDKKGEELENSLVMIPHVRLTESSLPWPGVGATGTNLTVTDNGVDSMTVRVPRWTNLNGYTPDQPFTLIGVAGQFNNPNSAPFNNGYQVFPRDIGDVLSEVHLWMKDTTRASVMSDVVIPVNIQNVNAYNISAYELTFHFDSNLVAYLGAQVAGTMSDGYTTDQRPGPGMATFAASGATALKDSGVLVNVSFKLLKPGMSMIAINAKLNEGNPMAYAMGGVVDAFVPRQIVEVKNNKMKVGITNVGHVGALNGYQDQVGFMINNYNALYEGSLLFGYDQTHISNAARFSASPSWNPGFRHLAPVMVKTMGSYIVTETAFDDANQKNPMGIKIHQSTALDTVPGNDGFLMMHFEVVNTTGASISNFKFGSFFDFDLTAAGDADRGGILKDSSNTIPGVNGGAPFKIHLAYTYNGGIYTGVVPVSQTVFAGGRIAIGPSEIYGGRMTDSAKYLYMSSFRPTNTYTDGGAANDMSMWSSVGPYTIPANDTVRGTFAVVVGSSLADLLASARNAQASAVKDFGEKIQVLTAAEDNAAQIPSAYDLSQNYPNPFNPSTMIRFSLPNNGFTTLKVYDMLGREVRTLVQSDLSAGFFETSWDGKNNNGASVASGVYVYQIQSGAFIATKKMMLLK